MKINKDKKGSEIKPVIKIVLMIIFLLVLTLIFTSKMKAGENSFNDIFNKYTGPKISISNSYGFKALDIIPDMQSGECTGPTGNVNTYDCKKDTALNFFLTVENKGLKDRSFYTAIVICKSGETDCCTSSSKIYVQNSKDFSLQTGGTWQEDFGPYTFKNAGSYDVYPAMVCPVNSDTGCPRAISGGQTESIIDCNKEQYITLNVN